MAIDMHAVVVWCEYDTMMYNGFSAYLQNAQNVQLVLASSTESGSSVVVNSNVNGEHFVYVYPIWMPGSMLHGRKVEPAYQETYYLPGAVGGNIGAIVGGTYIPLAHK